MEHRLVVVVAAFGFACSGEPEQAEASPIPDATTSARPIGAPALSPTARIELHEMLAADRVTPRHPSDGGGSLRWISVPEGPVAAGSAGRWSIELTVGPLGVVEDGAVYLQTPPFWGWSQPQTLSPEYPGYTRITTSAAGVILEPEGGDQGVLIVRVRGRALVGGETIAFDYGAGPLGASADRFAEHDERFWVSVDGDGDGMRALVTEGTAKTTVIAGPAAGLSFLGPSTAHPGEHVRLKLAALDLAGNSGTPLAGTVALDLVEGTGKLVTPSVALGPDGRADVELETTTEGVLRVAVRVDGHLSAVSNPILVSSSSPRWIWADLHGHSQLSDGTGTPDDYFSYARDVAALDVVALTDHDHWGLQPLAMTPQNWRKIQDAVTRWNEPSRFVTLLGYEWTSWLHGHRHVLWFSDEPDAREQVLDSVDPAYSSPLQLWEALRPMNALTLAHHSAGGPVATNWSIPPDPMLEPVTEIASVHGQSEAPDAPGAIYDAVPGNFVRDALDKGYRLGFVGSGDTHDGHPGLAHLAGGQGGLAAIQVDTLTRSAVKQAMSARRVYATNGPRIILRVTLDGEPMGSDVKPSAEKKLAVFVVAPEPLRSLDVVRSGKVTALAECEGRSCTGEALLSNLGAGEYLYVRAFQADGGAAWSSPFFVTP